MSMPLTSSTGSYMKCRWSSRTMIVLLSLLTFISSSGATASIRDDVEPIALEYENEFVKEEEKARASLLFFREEAWAEAKPVDSNHCTTDSDCAWHARCGESSHECRVVSLGQMVGADIIMCCLAFVIAGFSLAAGVGGGGLYVPLLMFVLSFDTRVATALSQAMLFGGAFAAFVYNIQMPHPAKPERPLINFELALLMAPALMGGAQVGSVLHALCPPLLILAMLLIVLADATRKGIRNAQNLSAKEAKQEVKQEDPASFPDMEPSEHDSNSEVVNARSKETQMKLAAVWALTIGLVATKGLLFEMCSPSWWLLTAGTAVLLSGMSWKFAGTLSEQAPVDEHDIDFRENAFSLVKTSLFAGAIAAMCGIGGGMVMGPILVELKVPPPVSAATTATTLVVLSTSTLLIYLCRGMAPRDYTIFLACFSLCGAAVGKVLVGWWVRKTGKQSIIVWTLAVVTVLSMILMGMQGMMMFTHAPWQSLTFRNFCDGHVHHTVPTTD